MRRIEKGNALLRHLPSLREDSMKYMQAMESIQLADYASGVSEEVALGRGGRRTDMPLQEIMP